MRRTLRNSSLSLLFCAGVWAQSTVYTKKFGGNRADTASAVAVDAQGNTYVVGTTNSSNFPRTQANPAQPKFANLLTTTDGGATYSIPPLVNPVLALASIPGALIAATLSGPYRSVDGGASWQTSSLSISTYSLLTDPRYPARAYAATSAGIYRSDDAGVTWSPTGTGLPAGVPVTAIDSSPQRPDVVFAQAGNAIYLSRDASQTWSLLTLPISPIGPAPDTIAIDPSNPNNIYIAGAFTNTTQQAYLLKSTDGGATFQQVSTLAILPVPQAIAIDPATPTSLVAAGIDGHAYHSADGGSTWKVTSLQPLTLEAIAFDPNHPTNLYALADQGLYVSSNHGFSWAAAAAAVPLRNYRSISFTPSTIFLGADAGLHAFLTKFDTTGGMLWSIVLGGSYFDQGTTVAVDSSGNPYVAGTTASTDFPVSFGSFQPNLAGSGNAFLIKFNSNGDQVSYSTYLGGSAADSASGVAIDPTGAAYVSGYATSFNFPTSKGSFQPRHNGACGGEPGSDAYVAKFTPSGALAYATLLGGGCSQTSSAIAVDSTGHAYVTGATISSDFPTTKGALQSVYLGDTDGFLAEFTPAGDGLVFSTLLGGQNYSSVAAGVGLDSGGNIYVAGNGGAFPFAGTPPISQFQCDGSLISYGGLPLSVEAPPFFLKLTPGATALYSNQTFSDCGTVVQSLSVDPAGRAWLGGIADNSNYGTVAPLQTLAAGGYFLREYATDASTVLFSTLLDGFQGLAADPAGLAHFAANSPSLSISAINPTTGLAVIDSIQKFGTLSIPALAGYSGAVGIAPGELISIQGHGLTGAVQIGGKTAPIVSSSPKQIVCVAPYEIGVSPRTVVQASNSNAVTVSVVPSQVEVLLLVNQDGTVNSASNPAPAGSTMTLYASGLGLPNGATPVDGSIGTPANQTFPNPVSVVFDDPAPLSYLGPAPGLISGITQINFVVPALPGQSILSVSAGASTDYVYVYLK